MTFWRNKVLSVAGRIPLVNSLQHYQSADFRHDLVAGLTVGVVLVPQGLAYAMLAGLPPIYGLYASLFPTAIYAIFGSAPQLSVGPVALTSLLVMAGISSLAEQGSPQYIGLAVLTALLVGIVQVVFGVTRMGFVSNFLSHPVIKGFTAAAAIIICGSQLAHLLGIPITRSNHIDVMITSAIRQLHVVHLPTLFLSVGTILLILFFRTLHKSFPGSLVALILGIVIVSVFRLDQKGVAIVGAVPGGLPFIDIPQFHYADVRSILSLVFLLTFVSMIESIAIAKTIESRLKTFRLNPDRELIALGVSKIIGAAFQAYPTTGSFSRTALNTSAGAKTGVASLVAALLVALTLVFLTPLFFYLPRAVLAAIIVSVVVGLIDVKTMRKLWRVHRQDFSMMFVTLGATLFLGIIQGVLAGVILSLVLMVYRSVKPHVTVLGRIEGTNHYRNVTRFPQSTQYDEILIVRFDAPVFFGNAYYFRDTIEQFIRQKGSKLKSLILDASSMYDIDSSGMNVLKEILDDARQNGIRVLMAGAIGPLRDRLFRGQLMQEIGPENQFLDVHDAILALEGGSKKSGLALQTNYRVEELNN